MENLAFTRSLPVPLTPEEFEAAAKDLAETDEEIETTEARKKLYNEGVKDKLGGLRSLKKELRTIVKNKAEDRDVDCKWFPDWIGRAMILRRLDTQEAVQTRTMTAEEGQMRIEDRIESEARPRPEDRVDDLDAEPEGDDPGDATQ